MKKLKPIYVNSIELNIPQVEDDNDFDMLCFDGYAMGSNGVLNVVMKYPAMSELSEYKIDKLMEYSFGKHWKEDKNLTICFSDVMMLYGKVTQIQQVNTI
jgi:hypothetical protein